MNSPLASTPRPQFRNIHVTQILQYSMPPPAMVSITHRISGALLFLALPLVLWLFQRSLLSESTYEAVQPILSHWLMKLVLLALAWAFLHHLVAGVRFLLIDLDIGVDKPVARASGIAVFAISLPLTLLVAACLFGVFR